MIPKKIYFIGAGGIGMANLERYYLLNGSKVAGYDRSPSELTKQLEKEGAQLVYDDDPALLPADFRNPADTLVVMSAAIPETNQLLSYFRSHGFEVIKRAALLGKITRHLKGICVAGSHGKTTTTSMIANILRRSKAGCNAFLGGILRNINSNFVADKNSPWAVIEADEYDRSFHQLTPEIAIITSTDPDHLDIYGDEAGYLEGFARFTELIRPGGTLLLHKSLKLKPRPGEDVKTLSYSGNDGGDWHAEDIKFGDGSLTLTIVGPGVRIENVKLGAPVKVNIDNAVAAAAAAIMAGATPDDVRLGLGDFLGAKRRFEIWNDGKDGTPVLIDDYAHSPNEVKASIESVKLLFPGRKITVVFQPHLYTRTRDFAPEFAAALSSADEVIMPEIYPAREKPIPGVDSNLILRDVKCESKTLIERKDLLNKIKNTNFEILMTLGAADLDRLLPDISRILKEKKEALTNA